MGDNKKINKSNSSPTSIPIKGKSIKAVFKADKGHMHHRLVAQGFSQKQAVLILYGISAIFGMFAVILCDSGIWKALSFLLIVIVAIIVGYKNFSVERTGKEQYECTQCKYIYNPKFGIHAQQPLKT